MKKTIILTISLLSIAPLQLRAEEDDWNIEDAVTRSVFPADAAFRQATELVHKLFAPIATRFTATRLFYMRDAIARRVKGGDEFEVAFLEELKKFLVAETKRAVEDVVTKKELQDVDVKKFVAALMDQFVISYQAKYNVHPFTTNPSLLPAHSFAFCVSEMLRPVLLRTGFPQQTRDISLVTLVEWAKAVHTAVKLVEDVAGGIREGLEQTGIIR